jgi:hypothetical protein
MNKKPQAHNKGAQAADGPLPIQVSEPVRSPAKQVTTEQHLEEVEREMNAFERSTLRWTKATFFILGVTCLFIAFQWNEMRTGSGDTHTLATAALAANRAWLAPNQILLTSALETGLPVHFQMQISNPGREPALGVVYRIKPRTVAYIPQTSVDEPNLGPNNACIGREPKPSDGSVVYPDAPGLKRWVPDELADTPENWQILANVLNRTDSLVIEGCMVYRADGKKHKSLFRFFLRDVAGQRSFVPDIPGKPGSAWFFNATLAGNEAD